MPSARRSAPTSRVPGRKIDARGLAGAQQRLDELLGVRRCRSPATTAPRRRVTAGSRRAMNARSTISRPLDAVVASRALRALRARHLVLVVRDDQLAAARVRHVVLGAELVQQTAPFDAQPRLERAGGIVDARVDDAAVVRAGVEARAAGWRSSTQTGCARVAAIAAADASPVTARPMTATSISLQRISSVADGGVVEIGEHQVVEDRGVRVDGVRDLRQRRAGGVGRREHLGRQIDRLHLDVVGHRRAVADLHALEAARAQQILQRLRMDGPHVREVADVAAEEREPARRVDRLEHDRRARPELVRRARRAAASDTTARGARRPASR